MEACLVCGERAIVEDEGTDGCTQKVCAECGVVQSSSHEFITDNNKEFNSSSDWLFSKQEVSRNMQRMLSTKQELKPRKLGLQRIALHGSLLGLSQNMIDESKELFTSSYMDHFLHRMMKFKLILAASCVYCVCRIHGHAVPIRQICNIAQIAPWDFTRVYKELCLHKKLTFPAYSLGSSIASVIAESTLDGPGKIAEKTRDILQFFRKHWLVTGRRLQHLIPAAIFLAWLSEDFASRRKDEFSKFCKQRKFVHNSTTRTRLKEMIDVLVELSRAIPWISSGSISSRNVPMVLNDILKYQNSILFDRLSKDGEGEGSESDSDDRPDSCFLPPSAKKMRVTPAADCDVPVELGHDLDNQEVTEADIDDSQLSKYIKTPEEVEDMKHVQLQFKAAPKS